MEIHFTKQPIKDTFYTLEFLNWLLRIFNLSCIYRKGNQLKASWSLTKNVIYASVFGFVNFFFLLSKIERLDMMTKKSKDLTFSDATQVSYLFGYLEYLIDLFYIRKYGREASLNYFKVYNIIDQILGMRYYDEVRKAILKSVVFCITVFIITSIFDYISWIGVYGWIPPTLYSLDYLYLFLNMCTVFDGMSHVIQIEYRLKMMKDLLQDYYASNNTHILPDDSKIKHKCKLDSLRTLSYDRFIEAIGFNRCYLLLVEQATFTNKKMGVRFIAFCTNLLINMMILTNIAIRVAIGSMVTPYGNSRLPSVSSMTRLLNWAAVGVIIVYRCEQNYRQSEEILEIIDLILHNKNNSNTLKTTLMDLRNLLITRPVKYHGVHFFKVDYTLLVSFTSVVMTYTIIMLQNMH